MTTIGNYNAEKIRSMMTLFKAVPGDAMDDCMPEIAMASLEDCILRGFIFVNQAGKVLSFVTMPLFVLAKEQYGIDKEVNNQTFWKSFERVRDMDPREYVMHQIAHYFSTYEMEMMGLKARTYVPVQDLDIPDNILPFKRMTVIRLVSGEDMIELINHYALTTTAPSKTRIEQFKPLMEYLTIKTDDIKSFEFQVIKHDMDGTVPADPQNFLRFLVYKTTDSTLLIKNRATRKAIQHAADYDSSKATIPYTLLSKADPTKLASIFFRYRPIFLAFKKFDGCAPIINKIRRLADIHHVPVSDISVQNLSTLVMQNRYSDAMNVIAKASNRELVKLFNFFNEHVQWSKAPGVYNIRNGRTFVNGNTKSHTPDEIAAFLQMSRVIKVELTNRLSKVLGGRKFYIPNYIEYAVPVTEKQFVGNIPWGSRILELGDEALTIGVSWFNQKNMRVDIDLHLNSATKHYGWCGSYTDGKDIIYTGDMTSAPLPNGAAEAYYFNPKNDKYITNVNLFSGPSDAEFKMYMTAKKPLNIDRSCVFGSPYIPYTFDPKDALFAPIPLKFNNTHDMTLGMFVEDGFYFYGGGISRGIVPAGNYGAFIDGLVAKLHTQITIDELLSGCGAIVLDYAEFAEMTDEEKKTVVSLAPEDLTATTLLDIVDGNF